MESLKNYRLYHYIRLTKFYGIILNHGSMCIDKQISLVCWGLMLLITGTKILYKKFVKAFKFPKFSPINTASQFVVINSHIM